jgi:hypothetical protein
MTRRPQLGRAGGCSRLRMSRAPQSRKTDPLLRQRIILAAIATLLALVSVGVVAYGPA